MGQMRRVEEEEGAGEGGIKRSSLARGGPGGEE